MKRYLSLIIFGVTLVWFVVAVLVPAGSQLTHGFAAYYTAAKLLINGDISEVIYDPAYFRPIVEADSHYRASDIYNANPPTTSLLFVPLTIFPIKTARVIWTVVNAMLLWGGVLLLVWVFAPTTPPSATLILLSIAMLFQPALENIQLGQAYLLIFFLLAITVVIWHGYQSVPLKIANCECANVQMVKQRSASSGRRLTASCSLSLLSRRFCPTSTTLIFASALASALLLKTAGWMLLPLLAWQRRWRWLVATILCSATILLLTLPLFPPAMWQRYLVLLHEVTTSPQVCATAYQTTRSLLCQLFSLNPPWSLQPLFHTPKLAGVIYLGLALVTLILSFRLSRHAPTAAMLSIITWGILFAPVGEQYHHTVMLIPLVWLILARQQEQSHGKISSLLLASAMLLYGLPWSFNQPLPQSGGWIMLAYPRLIAAWLIWLALLQKMRGEFTDVHYPKRR